MIRPQVLLLDEPLGALDLKLREELQVEIKRVQSTLGITTLFVTHDQGEALGMSDRVAVMREGEIVQIDTPQALYERPNSEYVANFVGRTNLIEVVIQSRDADGSYRVESVGDGGGDVQRSGSAAWLVRDRRTMSAGGASRARTHRRRRGQCHRGREYSTSPTAAASGRRALRQPR